MQVLDSPVYFYLLQLALNVLLFHSTDANILMQQGWLKVYKNPLESPTQNLTSMSSLNFNIGASMIFLSWNDSDSMLNVCLVSSSILFQCLSSIALLDIISSKGQLSLKSSIFFLSSMNAGHSFSALGSLRHLKEVKSYTLNWLACSVLVLEVQKFTVDLLNVNFYPEDVIVAIDTVNNCIIEPIQLL